MSMEKWGMLCGICMATGMLAGSPVAASPIGLVFEGSGLRKTIVAHSGPTIPGAIPNTSVRTVAGQTLWQVQSSAGGTSPAGSQLQMFSMAVSEVPASGNAVLMPLLNSSHLEDGKANPRAGLLRNLFSSAHALSSQSDLNAAAFQVAIWEVMHEGGFNPLATSFAESGLDASHSASEKGFWIGPGRYGQRDPIAAIANQWLSESWQQWQLGRQGAALSVATGSGFSEQVMMAMPIPLPSAGGLALVGILGLGATRRRRA